MFLTESRYQVEDGRNSLREWTSEGESKAALAASKQDGEDTSLTNRAYDSMR